MKVFCCFACGRTDTLLREAFLIWDQKKQDYHVWPKPTHWCTACLKEVQALEIHIQQENKHGAA